MPIADDAFVLQRPQPEQTDPAVPDPEARPAAPHLQHAQSTPGGQGNFGEPGGRIDRSWLNRTENRQASSREFLACLI